MEREPTSAEQAPDDPDFTVAQEGEFSAPSDEVSLDEDRPIDDGAKDDIEGVDAERRVDLGDDRERPEA